MSIYSIFKESVCESSFSEYYRRFSGKSLKNVNEAYDDNAVGWLTRNNILPQLFSGNRNGLRVKPALKEGQPLPRWDVDYLIYPFVGINGYSIEPAIVAKHGNYASYMRENLKELGSSPSVKAVLDRQVSNGTGIPGDAFLIFPKTPIETAASRAQVRSLSVFVPYNKKDNFSNSIYPYNVQQAFSVNERGSLYVDESKPGGVVICPMARNSQRGTQISTSALMIASPLTDADLSNIAHLENRSILARQVTDPGGMLHSYISGARNFDGFSNGNPDYRNFKKFSEENGFITNDGEIDVNGIKNWILREPESVVINRLIKPYLLMTPFSKTYCWRIMSIKDKVSHRRDIAVYKALCSEGGQSFESNLENADNLNGVSDENGEGEFYDVSYEDGDVGESEIEFEVEPFSRIDEALNENISVGAELGSRELMEICRKYVKHAQPTFMMVPKERTAPQIRDDGRIRTKSEGMKRTFVRILTNNTPFNEIDAKFCPKDFAGMIPTYSGVLDYSRIFSEYGDMLDMNSPKTFKYTRIVGYMISFQYDAALEEEYKKGTGHGKLRFNGLLNYYIESPNGVMYREPTIFDVLYIHGDKSMGYGDFIFSGYATNGNGTRGGEPSPEIVDEIESKRLFADSTGLHSAAAHGLGFQKIPYSYNKSVF